MHEYSQEVNEEEQFSHSIAYPLPAWYSLIHYDAEYEVMLAKHHAFPHLS